MLSQAEGRVTDARHHYIMTRISVRSFKPNDQAAVKTLIQNGMQERWGSAYDPAMNPDTDDIWGVHVANGVEVIVAEIGDVIVGTGMLSTESGGGRLRRVAVHREWRRRAVGRRIIEELCSLAAVRGLDPLRVRTDTPWNDAVTFYESCGFTVSYRDEGETELVRTIGPVADRTERPPVP